MAWKGRVFVAIVAAVVGLLQQLAQGFQRSLLPRALAIAVGSLSSVVSGMVKSRFEIENWKRRVYLNRLQVVLMSVDCSEIGEIGSPRVEKRTLFEGSLLDSIMNGNSAAAALVSKAASQCNAAQPFVTQHLEKNERYQVLNQALNLVSSFSTDGHLAEDILPGSTIGSWYVFAICAQDSLLQANATVKVRIILLKEETLKTLSQCSEETLVIQDARFRQADSARHECRWLFIRQMAKMYHEQRIFHDPAQVYPDQEKGRPMHVLRLFLSVPHNLAAADALSTAAAPTPQSIGTPANRKSLARAMRSERKPSRAARNAPVSAFKLRPDKSPAMYSPNFKPTGRRRSMSMDSPL